MDKDEIKQQLLNVISNLIKDEPDAAQANVHDVLQAKMRDRVNPQPEATEVTDPEATDPEVTDPVVTDPASTEE